MDTQKKYEPKSAPAKWLESRLPVISLIQGSFIDFPTPKNLNYWWTFGAILTFMLVVQIVTGIVLSMHYSANTTLAFRGVEEIMRDVNLWMVVTLFAL